MSPSSRSLKRVLIVSSNPADTERLGELAEEIRQIKKALTGDSFSVEVAEAARIEDLQEQLIKLKPNYVHFCGHGLGDFGIVFHHKSGMARTIPTARLEALFEGFKAHIRCVFLNCCFSQAQGDAIGRHVPYVIGTTQEIGDGIAREFASFFYSLIASGKTIPRAFDLALSVTKGTPDEDTPVLIERTEQTKGAAGERLFAGEQEAQIVRRWIIEKGSRMVFLQRPASLKVLASRNDKSRRLSLALRLAHELDLSERFEYRAGKSLSGKPSIQETVKDLLPSASRHLRNVASPAELMDSLLRQLDSQRCLIALEDLDAILTLRNSMIDYLEGHEAYGELFRRIAETLHESCLVLSGRMIPSRILEWAEKGLVQILELPVFPDAVQSTFQLADQSGERAESLPIKKKNRVSRSAGEPPHPPSEISSEDFGHFLKILLRSGEAIIFLGPGAAAEGRQKGKPYPTLENLARRVLASERQSNRDSGNLRSQLQGILRRWAEEAPYADFLSHYLAGEPGPAHYYLAALALTLFPQCRLLLFVVTGFDDLLAEAFTVLQSGESRVKVHVVSLDPMIGSDEIRRTLRAASARVNRGEPVILKLFGELSTDSPLLYSSKAKLGDALRIELKRCLQNPSIFIGCELENRSLQDLILRTPERGPVLIAGSENVPAQLMRGKGIYHFPASFRAFTSALLTALEEEKALPSRAGELLLRLRPYALYPDCESISNRAEVASRASLSKAKDRLPHSEDGGEKRCLIPIRRPETQPDLRAFLQDPRPLLVVVGDSGTGKSTLFYQVYHSVDNFIPILYDVHEIEPKESLTRRLSHDLLCEESQLEIVLVELDKVLQQASRHLLILVDGINESQKIKPSILKAEIDGLARRLPGSVKIAYSCRKVYWDTYISDYTSVPKDLYFGAKEFTLGRFSVREAEEAFQSYQYIYGFDGSYAALSAEFKRKITDPLMLRMLAEGYRGKRLPSFAPAVLIFDAYLKRLHREFNGTLVPLFLTALIEAKVRESETGRPSDQFYAHEVRIDPKFSALIQQQLHYPKRPGDPLHLLEDEGVLVRVTQDEAVYRFAYDRFFEYLLGRALPLNQPGYRRVGFLGHLREQILRLSNQQLWFLQALKSELIRLNIENPAGPWSLYDPASVRELLADPDVQVAMFAKDVLRELMFEGEIDLLPVVENASDDIASAHLLMLDLAPESPRVLPLIVEGLTREARDTARRCCHLLVSALSDEASRKLVEEIVFDMLRGRPLSIRVAAGLIYYSASLFGEADRREADPIPIACEFWKRVWVIVGGESSAKETLAAAFAKTLRQEGGHFFGDASEECMDYVWRGMSAEVKTLALRLAPLAEDPDIDPDPELREIIYFFGSSINDWSDRKNPQVSSDGGYKLEYKMAEWILLQRCKTNYSKVKAILEEFVATGYWKSIDFSLSEMDQCCSLYLWNQKDLLEDARRTMIEWTAKFREDEANFYMPLSEENPFSIDQCPIAMAAAVDTLYFSPTDGPIPFLERWLTSEDTRDVLLALLCTRNLWRENPGKVLGSLALVTRSSDETVRSWLDRILKEIYLIYPRLVEDFLRTRRFAASRIQAIKHRSDVADPSSVEHDGNSLYKALFLGPVERRRQVGEWYRRLHASESLESFCSDLIGYLLTRVTRTQ